jgi:hypothetical protein
MDLVALAEVLDSTGRLSLALLPKPLVMQQFDGLVEGRRPVAATGRGVQRVKNGLGPVSGQGDRVGGVLDQPELDRVSDCPSSFDSLGTRLVRRLHPQVLRHERRRPLVERVRLAGDLEHDVHSAEPISAMVGVGPTASFNASNLWARAHLVGRRTRGSRTSPREAEER